MKDPVEELRVNQRSALLALGALSVAALLFMCAQTYSAFLEQPMLKGQISFFSERAAQMRDALQQTQQAIQERNAVIQKGEAQEKRYAALLSDLVELAKVDPLAQLVTTKWKMQRDGNAAVANPPRQSEPGAPRPLSKDQPAQKKQAPRSPESRLKEPALFP